MTLRGFATLTALGFSTVGCFAEIGPVFDENYYSVDQVVDAQNILVTSNTRQFFCSYRVGSIGINVFGCAPFLTGRESSAVAKVNADAAQAAVAAAAAAVAAVDAADDEKARKHPIDAITEDNVKNAIVLLARGNACALSIGSPKFPGALLHEIAVVYGYSKELDGAQLTALRNVSVRAVETLELEGAIEVVYNGTKITLKDCN